MPPPKRPKTGLSRVEEYLSASEKEELASQGSVHSPDCSSPSHTEELAWKQKDYVPVEEMHSKTSVKDYSKEYTRLENVKDYQDEYTLRKDYTEYAKSRDAKMEYNRMSRQSAVDSSVSFSTSQDYNASHYSDYMQVYRGDNSYRSHDGNNKMIVGLMQSRKVDALFHALQNASPPPPIDSFRRPSTQPPPLEALPEYSEHEEKSRPPLVSAPSTMLPYASYPTMVNSSALSSKTVSSTERYNPQHQRDYIRASLSPTSYRTPSPVDYHRSSISVSPPQHYSPTKAPASLTYSAPYVHWQSEGEEEDGRESTPPPSPSTNKQEQDIPLDFSHTAKSVLARMMSVNLPTPPPQAELLCSPRKSVSSWATSNNMLPPSADTRSLSPGEWRPGMPSSGQTSNQKAPSHSSHIYQDNSSHHTELPPSGEKAHWKSDQRTLLPPSVNNRQWDPEESSSGEGKDATISSTSSSSQQQQQVKTSAAAAAAAASSPLVQEMPTSTMSDEQRGGPRPRYMDKRENCTRRCQICNDMASGFHYGVWSCEGCKAFFKRSLQGTPVDYVCPATNNCTIDKHRRKSCQACRLRKCIEMGMNRGKKGPRGPRGPNKRKLMETGQLPMPMPEPNEPRIKIKKEIVDVNETRPPVPAIKCTEIHPLAEYMMKIDPPTRTSGHDNTQSDSEVAIVSSLMKLADTELVDVINWAKSIPGYTDLQMADRIHLLEASWMEILMMGILWRSYQCSTSNNTTGNNKPHSPNSSDSQQVLVFAPDLHIDKARACVSGIGSVCEKMLGLTRKFSALQLNREEFVLLRSMLLFNAEISDLPSCAKIESLREKLIEALQYTSCERLRKSSDRVAHLLLFLPHIRQCALTAISRLFELGTKHKSSLPSYQLLQEMIEARSPMVLPPVMCRHLMPDVTTAAVAALSQKSHENPPSHSSAHNSMATSTPHQLDMSALNFTSSSSSSSSSSSPLLSNAAPISSSPFHMNLPQPRMTHQIPVAQQQQVSSPATQSSQPSSLPHRYPTYPTFTSAPK